MIPIITAFEQLPGRGQGLARDTRARWALEEVDQPYEARLVSLVAMKESENLALHPFGPIGRKKMPNSGIRSNKSQN